MTDQAITARVRATWLHGKITSAQEAAQQVADGMTLGIGAGNTISCAKTFFAALAKHLEGKGKIRLITGGPLPHEIDGLLTQADALARRYGQFGNPALLKAVNRGKIPAIEYRTGTLPHHVRDGRFGRIDVAAIEAAAITEEGFIVPGTSCLDVASYVMLADKIIVEINSALPAALEGIHDIYIPEVAPWREPIPLKRCGDRIGKPFIACDPAKITAIVEATIPDNPPLRAPVDWESVKIAEILLDFFKNEVRRGRLPQNLLPLQFGIGAIPEALAAELSRGPFSNLEVFTGAFGDGGLNLIDSGKAKTLSTSALYFSKEGFERFYNNLPVYKSFIVIRPVVLSDCPELVARLGVIAMNGALEVDIYGHVNSTHILGTKLLSGVGGSCDFLMNAYLSIILLPASSRNATISRIVPMVSHVDHTEHNIDIIVTEQGLADLRGLAPVERAEAIIENCAHPEYRHYLKDYLEEAIKTRSGHEPQILEKAFALHTHHLREGDMRAAFRQ
jgi:succinyl-CoA:acetate CoA-transferase